MNEEEKYYFHKYFDLLQKFKNIDEKCYIYTMNKYEIHEDFTKYFDNHNVKNCDGFLFKIKTLNKIENDGYCDGCTQIYPGIKLTGIIKFIDENLTFNYIAYLSIYHYWSCKCVDMRDFSINTENNVPKMIFYFDVDNGLPLSYHVELGYNMRIYNQ